MTPIRCHTIQVLNTKDPLPLVSILLLMKILLTTSLSLRRTKASTCSRNVGKILSYHVHLSRREPFIISYLQKQLRNLLHSYNYCLYYSGTQWFKVHSVGLTVVCCTLEWSGFNYLWLNVPHTVKVSLQLKHVHVHVRDFVYQAILIIGNKIFVNLSSSYAYPPWGGL